MLGVREGTGTGWKSARAPHQCNCFVAKSPIARIHGIGRQRRTSAQALSLCPQACTHNHCQAHPQSDPHVIQGFNVELRIQTNKINNTFQKLFYCQGFPFDGCRTAETDIACTRIWRQRHARRHAVAIASKLVAHVGAALFHLVVAEGWTLRILLRLCGKLPRVPVIRPLPHIANSIVQAKLVGLVGIHRCRQFVTVLGRVLSTVKPN